MDSEEFELLKSEFDQFDLIAPLAAGGMGAVFEARQTSLNRKVAIKILTASGSEIHSFAERFQREAQVLASLNHPNIVTIYDFGYTNNGRLFIAMELVEGLSLEDKMLEGGLTLSVVLDWIVQICDALQAAHDRGIIHRDIKPSNILITADGRAKVADFGLASVDSAQLQGLTMEGVTVGTPEYIAPELFEIDSRPDNRSDIYSLGVMLYQLLTGSLPKGAWKLPSEVLPELDHRFDEVILKSLDHRPDSRYQSTNEIRNELFQIAKSPGLASYGEEKRGKSGSLKSLVFGGVLLVAVAWGAFHFQANPEQESEGDTTVQISPVVPKEAGSSDPTQSPADASSGRAPEKDGASVPVTSDALEKQAVALKPKSAKGPEPAMSKGEGSRVTGTKKDSVSGDEEVAAVPAKMKPAPVAETAAVKLVEEAMIVKDDPAVSALKSVVQDFRESYEGKIAPWYWDEVTNLNILYRAAIERKLSSASPAELEVYKKEIDGIPTRGFLDLDGNSGGAQLEALREVYRSESEKVKRENINRSEPLTRKLHQSISEIESKFGNDEVSGYGAVKSAFFKDYAWIKDGASVITSVGEPDYVAPWLFSEEIANADAILISPDGRDGTMTLSAAISRLPSAFDPEQRLTYLVLLPGSYPGDSEVGFVKEHGYYEIPELFPGAIVGDRSSIEVPIHLLGRTHEIRGVKCREVRVKKLRPNGMDARIEGCIVDRIYVEASSSIRLENSIASVTAFPDSELQLSYSTIVPGSNEPNLPPLILSEGVGVEIVHCVLWSTGELFRLEGEISRSRLKSGVFHTKSSALVRDSQGGMLVPAGDPDEMTNHGFLLSRQWTSFTDPQFLGAAKRDFRISDKSPAHQIRSYMGVGYEHQGASLDSEGWPLPPESEP